MSADKRIVLTFLRRGERTDAAELAIGAELFAATRQYLMTVSLMTDIPHDAVFGSVENIVQGYRQLDDT